MSTPHNKEYAYCLICGKYKGCWMDTQVCSDCDEEDDERRVAENHAAWDAQEAEEDEE